MRNFEDRGYNTNMNQHYICTGGCGGVSDKPGVCQAEGCPKHGHILESCDCADGKHHGRLNATVPQKPDSQKPVL